MIVYRGTHHLFALTTASYTTTTTTAPMLVMRIPGSTTTTRPSAGTTALLRILPLLSIHVLGLFHHLEMRTPEARG